MTGTDITAALLAQFAQKLYMEEKSRATIEKYVRDVKSFASYAGTQELSKNLSIAYKRELQRRGYAQTSINSMLAALNSFLSFCGRTDCRVKFLRIQRRVYMTADRELSKEEYQRLLNAASQNKRLWLLLQTICATGIRVSELQYFTVEAVEAGEICVVCKNKSRSILIPDKLRRRLLQYAVSAKITTGVIFRTRTGRPLNRSNIWSALKRLCVRANVKPGKVFPP